MPKQRLYFDLDGTLLDTQPGIAESIRHTLNHFGFPPVSLTSIKRCFGPPMRVSLAQLMQSSDTEQIEAALIEFRRHYFGTAISSDGVDNQGGISRYRIYPGIEDLLRQLLEQDVELAVLTAKPQPQAEWLLQHSGLDQYFPQLHGSHDKGARSNKSSHLGLLLAHSTLPAERCWMIGDRADDINAARNNGVTAIAAHWGYGDEEELQQAGFDHRIDTPQQLLNIL
ncbi:MAG: HAD hydrolase-like protein [Motiliproteus sp.]